MKRWLLAAAALTAMSILFYWPVVTGQRCFPGDASWYFYPMQGFAARTWHSWRIPLWNPYVLGGTPIHADPQACVFSPAMLLLAVPASLSRTFFDTVTILHLIAAGWLILLSARHCGVSMSGALLSAVVWTFGGVTATRLGFTAQIYLLPWFAAAFLALMRWMDTRRPAWAALFVLSFGVVLASCTHPALLMGIALGAYVLCHPLAWRLRGGIWPGVISVFVLAAGISAIQVLPTLELARWSHRAHMEYQEAAGRSVSPLALASLVRPIWPRQFGGNPSEQGLAMAGDIYIGIIPAILVALGIAQALRANRTLRFPLIMGAVSLIYALGRHTPLLPFLFHHVPGFNLFRRPPDALYLTHFSLAILAGAGLHAVLRASRRPWRWLAAPIILASFWGMYSANAHTEWHSVPVPYEVVSRDAICADGAGAVDEKVVPFLRSRLSEHPGALYRIQPAYGLGRCWSNAPCVWRLPSTCGYSPLHIRRYGELANCSGGVDIAPRAGGMVASMESRLFDLLGARYVVSPRNAGPGTTSGKLSAVFASEHFMVYENRDAMPRAFLVHSARSYAGDPEIRQALCDPGFDPRRMVVLAGVERIPTLRASRNAAASSEEFAAVEYEGPSEVRVATSTAEPAFLVLTDAYYPGWRTFIDGRPAELLRADYAFRAVHLPPGVHSVRFEYRPRALMLGAGISALSLLAGAGLCVASARRRRPSAGMS